MQTRRAVSSLARRGGRLRGARRTLAEETAVAISYNGSAHVVLMATPADLVDLAVGFSLTEGIVAYRGQIADVAVEEGPLGIDLRVWLEGDSARALEARRRNMVGPVGCGMCGIESLEEAMRAAPPVSAAATLDAGDVGMAVAALAARQTLNAETHAVHAAGYFRPGKGTGAGLVALREDVGRHNALDKLVGAMAAGGAPEMADGAIIVTSRLSVELVQKCARAGCGLLIGVSAPTTLAVETARRAGITLIAVARGDEFEIFTHPERITQGALPHVA